MGKDENMASHIHEKANSNSAHLRYVHVKIFLLRLSRKSAHSPTRCQATYLCPPDVILLDSLMVTDPEATTGLTELYQDRSV